MRPGPKTKKLNLEGLGAFSLIFPKALAIFNKYKTEHWGEAELHLILSFMLLRDVELLEIKSIRFENGKGLPEGVAKSITWARMFLECPSMVQMLADLEKELGRITGNAEDFVLLIFLLRVELGDQDFCNRFLNEKAGDLTDILKEYGIQIVTTSVINHARERIKALCQSSPKAS